MSQGVIPLSAGGGGAAVRGKINAALQRLQTKGSGTARPSDIAAGEDWIETDNPGAGTWSWWLYDGTSDILLGTINSTTHAVTLSGSAASLLTTKGDLIKAGASGVPARFGVGGAFYGLHVNSAGDDLEYRRNGWEKIADDVTPAGASTIDFTSLPSNVKHLMAVFSLKPSTGSVALRLRLSQSASFVTSSVYHTGQTYIEAQGGASGVGSVSSQSSGQIGGPNVTSGGSSAGLRGVLFIPDAQGTDNKVVNFQAMNLNTGNGNCIEYRGSFFMAAAGAVDGLRFFFDSGNVSGGFISLMAQRG